MKTVLNAPSVACLALLFSALSIKANLIQADSPRFGQNALTIDSSTGLAWLDLPFSANYSYLQAVAATQPGGVFEGFRHATVQEVLTLYTDAGIPGTGTFPESSDATQAILSLISLVGATSFQDGHPQTIGITGTVDFPGGRRAAILDFGYVDGVPSYLVTGSVLTYGETFSATGVGNWLVYQVPEPSSSLLVIIGAVLIFARVRRPLTIIKEKVM